MRKFRYKKDGFTLVEIMISVAILLGAILIMISLFAHYLVLIELSKNTTVALNDAQAVLEQIRNTDPAFSIPAAYPHGSNQAPLLGPTKLDNETIVVTYVNTNADPLDVTVTVTWQDRGRNRSETLTTLMTDR